MEENTNIMTQEDNFDDLSEFAVEEKVDIPEDFTGLAKGFPDWDLLPPAKEK